MCHLIAAIRNYAPVNLALVNATTPEQAPHLLLISMMP
jgi:hypothetical protein